ncbi:hypothetical protein M3Y97_00652600 [Aphelenchoides bicaudatus]|nr:hypothetical protein M3Y97_00652600 [Aphelenchoides bicaudatus]
MKTPTLLISSIVLLLQIYETRAGIGFRQSAAAAGRLICNGEPSVGTKIKLYDEDRTDIDDLMAESYTDERGYFYLSGFEDEITSIDPKLNIYHDCNDGFRPCQRKLQIRIPDEYISRGPIPHRVYHLGVLNLDGEISGEYHDSLPNLFGSVQSAAVRGQLKCNGQPAANVKVKLYDEDRTDIDDLMDEGYTDEDGHFELSGKETELTSIDPKLNVYHDCNDESLPCLKKFSIYLPEDYVSEGPIPKKTFDAGVINLSGQFSGESRDCLN